MSSRRMSEFLFLSSYRGAPDKDSFSFILFSHHASMHYLLFFIAYRSQSRRLLPPPQADFVFSPMIEDWKSQANGI
jgi:hypothetical protein